MQNEVAISLPFQIDAYGKVGSTQSQAKIWQDKVLSVIGTALRERVMRPGFGTLIPYAMFENNDDAANEVRLEVAKAFNQQLQPLTLNTTDVTYDEYTNIMNVNITYSLPNSEQISTTIGLIKIDGTKPAYQELL